MVHWDRKIAWAQLGESIPVHRCYKIVAETWKASQAGEGTGPMYSLEYEGDCNEDHEEGM